jgi:hypothetical protein
VSPGNITSHRKQTRLCTNLYRRLQEQSVKNTPLLGTCARTPHASLRLEIFATFSSLQARSVIQLSFRRWQESRQQERRAHAPARSPSEVCSPPVGLERRANLAGGTGLQEAGRQHVMRFKLSFHVELAPTRERFASGLV